MVSLKGGADAADAAPEDEGEAAHRRLRLRIANNIRDRARRGLPALGVLSIAYQCRTANLDLVRAVRTELLMWGRLAEEVDGEG